MRLHRTMHAGGVCRKWVFTRRRWRATRDLLVAVGRMENWAESSDARRGELWRNLHSRSEDLREALGGYR